MSIRTLTPELAEKARIELNEDPKRISSDLQHIKDWLAKQPHIYARTDDQWLIAFLRGCKHSLERAKEKLDLYYTLRTLSPELYEIRDNHDSVFDHFMDLGIYIILPQTVSPNSPRLGIVRLAKFNPEKYSMTNLFGVTITMQKLLLLDDDVAVVNGTQWLIDVEGLTMAHILQITPSIVMKMGKQHEDAAPLRMKEAHFVNSPVAFVKIINLLKSMLNEKNRNRIFVHGKNFDDLYQFIPKSLLPAEYGGDNGRIREITDAWKTKRRQYGSWLEEDVKYKTDESKRPGTPKTAESLFGIKGSFRQLEFD
ncbi:alpha-tocopherol transfer protein-like [Maniola hyperantus]|uniref:alpha-tocopherol transfer protein-like n=1 Tax=Aphantopus hyperantus TaxID=2795564 RepID=UPI001569BA9F|nr:alpha-tocopherol transfer protein-like [Maniola hyperantus]